MDDTNPAFGQKYTQNQISAGAGGPIIKDKLFTFGAITFSHRTDPLLSLLAADPLTLERLGNFHVGHPRTEPAREPELGGGM